MLRGTQYRERKLNRSYFILSETRCSAVIVSSGLSKETYFHPRKSNVGKKKRHSLEMARVLIKSGHPYASIFSSIARRYVTLSNHFFDVVSGAPSNHV